MAPPQEPQEKTAPLPEGLTARQELEAAIAKPGSSLFSLRGLVRKANLTLPEGSQSMTREQLVAVIQTLLAGK